MKGVLLFIAIIGVFTSCSSSDDTVKRDSLLHGTTWTCQRGWNIPVVDNPEFALRYLTEYFPTMSYTIDEQTTRDTLIYNERTIRSTASSLTFSNEDCTYMEFEDNIESRLTGRYNATQCTFIEQECVRENGDVLQVRSDGAYFLSYHGTHLLYEEKILPMHNYKYIHCTFQDTVAFNPIKTTKVNELENLSFKREGDVITMKNRNRTFIGTFEDLEPFEDSEGFEKDRGIEVMTGSPIIPKRECKLNCVR